MVKDVLADTAKKMKASADHFRKEIGMLRTGRANIGMFEDIKVSYYGVMTPVNQVATLKVPEPTLIVVQPYDPSVLEAVDKAIRGADLGLNPLNDGKLLRVPIPPLDEERRREMAKKIGKMLEEEKTALRNMRREAKEFIEELEKEKEITEDEKFSGIEQLQKLLDETVAKAEESAAAKEKEILER
ncbi:MAG: ribosome recycling factor [Candidatus Aminicenantes bacterium]|nr:ribosome recycling factor [Candidatus Aminicenantes bacterium]NLH75758.1 ribosome recycling factor [Acidobacteriota bacterium]